MNRYFRRLGNAPAALVLALIAAACAPAAPVSPTAAPSKPTLPATSAPVAAPSPKPAVSPQPAASPSPAMKPSPQAGGAPSSTSAPLSLTDSEKAEVAGFFRDKTLRLLVGYAPGGGYDLFARQTATVLTQTLPGNPTVIVENMPGAGSLVLANHLYNVAPKDGTVIGTIDPSLVTLHAMGGNQGAGQFDPKKVPWLGSPTSSTNFCMVRTASGVTSMEQLLTSTKEITFGATTVGGSTALMPSIMQLLGAKVKIVSGYPGINNIALAVEAGEADGMCGTWESVRSTQGDWLKGTPPLAKPIVKAKPDAEGQLKDVPEMRQYLKTDEQRQIFDIGMASQTAGFVYAAAEGTPALRVKALRVALLEAWNHPTFKQGAEKANLAVIVLNHQRIEELFGLITNAPADVLKRAKDVYGIV